jgi:hypothetical protein
VVVVELLAAVALGLLAYWWWQRGVIVSVTDRVTLDRIVGGWWGAATAAVTVAGLLLLNAGHRVFGRTPTRPSTAEPGGGDRHG